jgi:hypothetical protein
MYNCAHTTSASDRVPNPNIAKASIPVLATGPRYRPPTPLPLVVSNCSPENSFTQLWVSNGAIGESILPQCYCPDRTKDEYAHQTTVRVTAHTTKYSATRLPAFSRHFYVTYVKDNVEHHYRSARNMATATSEFGLVAPNKQTGRLGLYAVRKEQTQKRHHLARQRAQSSQLACTRPRQKCH